jgi:hypothetical protein
LGFVTNEQHYSKTTSTITKKSANDKAAGTRNGMLKTGSLKYSASLYEKPMHLMISPEMMNKIPTNILEIG